MPLNPVDIRRLAFIKYLYQVAVDQSRAPEPLAAASILSFHDAAELFLQLASEHLNAGSAKPNFMDYWPDLSAKLPSELGQKESMRRLNKARVALKHHGTFPSKLDIEAFRATATSFFEDNTPLVFGIPFAALSLIEFVQPEIARQSLQAAQAHLGQEAFPDALRDIALAFQQMLDDRRGRTVGWYGSAEFTLADGLGFPSSHSMNLGPSEGAENLRRFIDRTTQSLKSIQDAVRILALGIDYRRYAKFKLLTPYAAQMIDGSYRTAEVPIHDNRPPTRDEVEFCLGFTIETTVHLQGFDDGLEGC